MKEIVLPVVTEAVVLLVQESLLDGDSDFDPDTFIGQVQSENPVLFRVIENLLGAFPEGDSRDNAERSLFTVYMLLRAQGVADRIAF